MIKIDEFQREFFDILVETKGFFIEEIGDANASIWIATKTLDSGLTYSIIISDKNNKEKNNKRAYNYLKQRGGEFSLSNIIVFNKKIQDKFMKFKESNEVLVDLHSEKIYGYDEKNGIFLNEIINSIFENKYIRKDKYYKTIGINEFTKYIIFVLMVAATITFLVVMLVEKEHVVMFFNTGPDLFKETMSGNIFLIGSGRIFEIIKDVLFKDGIISLIVDLYVLYLLIGVIDSFEDKNKLIIMYLIVAFLAGLFNLFFIPYMSLTISIAGAILGVLGLTLFLALKERKTLGKWLMVNVIILICIYIVLGIPSLCNYYTTQCIDLSIGFLIGGILYKANLLKSHFYNF